MKKFKELLEAIDPKWTGDAPNVGRFKWQTGQNLNQKIQMIVENHLKDANVPQIDIDHAMFLIELAIGETPKRNRINFEIMNFEDMPESLVQFRRAIVGLKDTDMRDALCKIFEFSVS